MKHSKNSSLLAPLFTHILLACTLLACTLLASSVLTSPLQAQLTEKISVRTANPIKKFTSVRVTGSNEAESVSPCSNSSTPYCANNTAEIPTPLRRDWTFSTDERRADLAVSVTREAEILVPGTSTTYRVRIENQRQEHMGRLFMGQGDTVYELAPADGQILNQFTVPVLFGQGAGGLATTPTTLLAGGDNVDVIYELDPDTGAILRTIPKPIADIYGLSFDDGEIFVLSRGGSLVPTENYRIIVLDYETGETLRTLGPYDSPNTLGRGITASEVGFLANQGKDIYRFEADDLLNDLEFRFRASQSRPPLYGLAAIRGELFVAENSPGEIEVYDLSFGFHRRTLLQPIVSNPGALASDEANPYSRVVDALVTAEFPPEISCGAWVCSVSGPGSGCPSETPAGDLSASIRLGVSAVVTYTADCAISPSATGTATVTASITPPADVSEAEPSDNTVVEIDSLVPSADLSITKTEDADPAIAGSTLTYTIEVTNPGPSDAASVVVAETLPNAVSLVSTTGCDNDPSGVPSCQLGTISAGGSASFTVEVTVDPDTPGSTIFNTASVASATADPNADDNDAAEATTIDDAEAPTITSIGSTLDTGDGELAECEEARVDITQLIVTFAENMQDPLGDADPVDVTNPANYRLVAAGDDGDFSTAACGTALGDDSFIILDAVAYDGGTQTATLTFNKGVALEDSLYRLLVCDSILDLVGNSLDGDGDGSAGSDFLRTYRVERDNLLINGRLDCGLDSWVAVSDDPGEITYATEDVQDSSVSGSAGLTNLTGTQAFSLGQCVDLEDTGPHSFSGSVRADLEPGATLSLGRICEFFADFGCVGASLSTDFQSEVLVDTAGLWVPSRSALSISPVAKSALCSFDLFTPGGDSFDVYFDDLRLSPSGLFLDGFESGDTSAWSSSVP